MKKFSLILLFFAMIISFGCSQSTRVRVENPDHRISTHARFHLFQVEDKLPYKPYRPGFSVKEAMHNALANALISQGIAGDGLYIRVVISEYDKNSKRDYASKTMFQAVAYVYNEYGQELFQVSTIKKISVNTWNKPKKAYKVLDKVSLEITKALRNKVLAMAK